MVHSFGEGSAQQDPGATPPHPPAGEWLSHTSANHHNNNSVNSHVMDQVPSPEKRLTISQIKESDWFLEGGYTEEDESQVIRQ